MATPKKLHVAKSLSELNKQTEIGRTASAKNLLEALPKIFQKAESCRLDMDEEQAYVLYMKFVGVVQMLRKTSDYNSDKRYYDSMIGTKNIKKCLEESERLTRSLEKRYQEAEEAKKVRKKLESAEIQDEVKPEEKKKNNEKKKDKLSTKEYDSFTLLTPKELYILITQQSSSYLLMDVRPAEDYGLTHIRSSRSVNISESFLQPGVTASNLMKRLDISVRVQFERRASVDKVILLDWFSKEISEGSSLQCLRDAMYKWDLSNNKEKSSSSSYACVKPFLLFGGFDNFLLHYPMEVTNPKEGRELAKRRQKSQNTSFRKIIPSINNLEYPMDMLDLNRSNPAVASGAITITKPIVPDRSMKPITNNNNAMTPPSIDRSLKAKVLLSSKEAENDKKVELNEVLEAAKDLAEDSVQLEKQELLMEHKWEMLRLKKEKEAGEEMREELQKNEESLLEALQQLRKEKLEKEKDNDRLLKELKEYKLKLDTTASPLTTKEEVERRVEEEIKRREIEKRDLQAEVEERRKDRKLKMQQQATKRESNPDINDSPTKRNNNMNNNNNVPEINRTVKPVITNNVKLKLGPSRKSLTGLKNLGNSCYMNSVLQCLANFSVPAHYFIEGHFQRFLNQNSETRGEIAIEFAEVMSGLWSDQYRFLAPVDMKRIVGKYMESFRGNTQQDSHEFLTKLMDWLNDDVNEVRKKFALPPEIEYSQMDEVKAANSWWELQKQAERSFIQETFYGQTRSTCKCLTCGFKSYKFEKFLGLTLNLPSGSGQRTLDQCIQESLAPEVVDYSCEKCNRSKKAELRSEIVRFPMVMAIQFKRFYRDYDIDVWRKKSNFVDFEFKTNLGRYSTACSGKLNQYHNYQLYGVCNHFGTMEGGHYTAYCYSDYHNRWHKFDDQDVNPMSSSDVKTSAAYILFYLAKKIA